MNIALSAFLLSLPVPILLEALTRFLWQARWTEREIKFSPSMLYSTLRLFGGLTIGFLFAVLSEAPESALAASAVGWLLILVVETDLRALKIPREPCWVVFIIGTVVGVATWSAAGAVSAGIALLALGGAGLFVALVSRGGLGSGDIRFMVALTPLAWWLGVTPVLVGVFIGCILQLLLRVILNLTHRGSTYLPFGQR